MGYLFCHSCGGYYELEDEESPSDFDTCQCGGRLGYTDSFYEINEQTPNYSILNIIKRRSKIIFLILAVILTFYLIMGVLAPFSYNTETPDGYKEYVNAKATEAETILDDASQALNNYDPTSENNDVVVNRLESDKNKLNDLTNNLATIRTPARYKNHRSLLVSAYKNYAEGIDKLIDAIKANDLNAINNAMSYFKNSENKLNQAKKELYIN